MLWWLNIAFIITHCGHYLFSLWLRIHSSSSLEVIALTSLLRKIRGSLEQIFLTFSSFLWLETKAVIDPCCKKLGDVREDLPVAISLSLEASAFTSLLRFAHPSRRSNRCRSFRICHFTVTCLVTWSWMQARLKVTLLWYVIQTSVLSYVNAN